MNKLILAALVSRMAAEGGNILKPAAAIIKTGDLEIVIRTIWQGDGSDRERLRKKVGTLP